MRLRNLLAGNLLLEGITATVYHTTSLRNAIEIVENDEFILAADFAKPSESKMNKPVFFLSTARSRLGAYHLDKHGYVSDYTVMFVLDGNKLAQNYKGAAVDYWQSYDELGVHQKDEMEDRVFSPTRTIPALKYTKYIDILIDLSSSYVSKQATLLYFVNLCKRKNVELRVFTSRQEFILGRNPVSAGEALQSRQDTKGFTGYPELRRRYKPSRPSELAQIVASFKFLQQGKLPPNEYAEILVGSYGYTRDYYKNDVVRKVMNDMHNNTRLPIMQDIANIMRFYKTNKISVVLDELLKKYKELE